MKSAVEMIAWVGIGAMAGVAIGKMDSLKIEPQVVIAVIGNESKRIPIRVTREAFVRCVENLDPDSLELARQIEACAGVGHE